jgi:phospholipid/cholesterol/gamma-HCH transport system ATP-binding protein
MGFLKPQVGSIRVEGEEINAYTEEEMRAVRKKVTMVFQNGALFDSLNVRENVAFPLREHGGLAEDQIIEIVERLIRMVGAEDVADAFPASLSTGRKRAVSIARALAAQPEVVLYDEPTTMVDPIIARRLGDLIQRLKRNWASPASWLRTTCALPKSSPTRYFFSIRAALATLDP